jgi:hypothetical protein
MDGAEGVVTLFEAGSNGVRQRISDRHEILQRRCSEALISEHRRAVVVRRMDQNIFA